MAKAKKARAPRKARKSKTDPAQAESDMHRLLRGIQARFSHAVPEAAASSGVHEPEEGSIEAKDVPNGRYRVAGSDWIMEVKNHAVALFQRAHPTLDPKGIKEVPPAIP